MRDYAKIIELCGIMRFWIYYAGSHDRIISKGLHIAFLQTNTK